VVTLRVAVCASSADIDRARSVAERLTAAGCHVTSDWWRTHPVTQGRTDAECTREERIDGSLACELAIDLAEAVLVLGSPDKSEGRVGELMYARCEHKQIVIVGRIPSAFGEPLDGERHHATDDAAIAYLADRVAGRWR
jgi:hypothetical protein